MGCNAPAPRQARSSYGPASGGGKGRASSPYGGQWVCGACGFSNKASNEVCGGGGPLGCKAPQMAPMMMMMPDPRMMGGMGKGGHGGGEWKCMACGFSNKAKNDVCGGSGPMGCKAPRPQGGSMYGMQPMPMMMMSGKGGNMMRSASPSASPRGQALNGKGGKHQGGWKCEGCGFQNKSTNKICGGEGPMGCNAPKPSDWVCSECAFVNKASNTQCGGKGPMGCNAPKPME